MTFDLSHSIQNSTQNGSVRSESDIIERKQRREHFKTLTGNDFLNRTPKEEEMKADVDKWESIESQCFYTATQTINSMKRQLRQGKEYLPAIQLTEWISKIYEEFSLKDEKQIIQFQN